MMKQSKYLILAACLLCAAACTKIDDEPDGNYVEGKTTEVSLNFKTLKEIQTDGKNPVNSETLITRAPETVTENQVENAWVFQFNGYGEDAKLMAAPYYINETESDGSAKAMLVETTNATRLVFAANINHEHYNWNMLPGVHTFGQLKERFINMSSESISYGGDAENLIMSATKKLDSGIAEGTDITDILFARSLAKINLKLSLTDEAADYKIISVQLRNVSSRLDIFDWVMDLSDDANIPTKVYPELTKLKTMDYDAIDKDKNGEDGESLIHGAGLQNGREFTWYLPRNARGKSEQQSEEETKNLFAFPGSTYFEIIAIDNDNMGVVYKFFPGLDNTNDFNIVPNYEYSIDFKIEGNGGAHCTDSRIEQFGTKWLDGNNNAYLINPSRDGMGPRQYNIPVIRVNDYWGKMQDGFGMHNNDGPLNDKDGAQEWIVELLWQDMPDLVRTDGNDAEQYVILNKTTGKGGKDNDAENKEYYFSFTVPSGKQGNFLVGLRRKDGTNILWSWHIWVTDYNPDIEITNQLISGDVWRYNVPGGQVERYGGTLWGYSGEAGNNWNNYDYAYNTADKEHPYANSVMMDRNIGAHNANKYNSDNKGVFFYQWGRKDPFPSKVDLYDIDGAKLGISKWNPETANAQRIPVNLPNPGTGDIIRQSINEPTMLYTTDGNKEDWSRLDNGNAYLWNDSRINKEDHFGKKSFFDPCPQGWKLPIDGTWNDFRMEGEFYTISDPARGLDFDMAGYYWPLIQEFHGYPRKGDICYPATGLRSPQDGKLGSEKYFFRSTTAFSDWNCHIYMAGSEGKSFSSRSNDHGKSTAITARCVRDDNKIESAVWQ